MRRVGYAIFGTYAFFNVITIFFLTGKAEFGPEIAGEYSIFSSQNFFIAYHVWGIVISIVCIYGMYKENRMLFMVGLLLITLIMFYPYFTGSPMDKAAGEQLVKEKNEQQRVQDSLDAVKLEVLPDSVGRDS